MLKAETQMSGQTKNSFNGNEGPNQKVLEPASKTSTILTQQESLDISQPAT
jgi:hypothetical protein